VLKNISFTVRRGETVGILGATGSGKSTLTYLLNRLYDLPESSGRITIGGVDIRGIDKYYLRRRIGIVLQEPFLYSRTLFENIDISRRSGDLDKVRRSAETACVGGDIESLPKKYDTVVGERGVTLSGGQKQRVAIARALMQDAPVMVFDDSMSSLDMQTDAKILSALRRSTRGATVFIVSHRISTLMHSDKIIVLEDGVITGSGTHAELLRSGGLYSRLYAMQSGEGARDV
jgi:ATP-binding cassette subfamily B protein